MAEGALAPSGWLLITSPSIYSLRARLRFLISAWLPHFERSSRAPIEEDHVHPIIFETYKRKIFDSLNLGVARVWTHPEGATKEAQYER
jgi:hypothetical protein